jgi:hypothetical protein
MEADGALLYVAQAAMNGGVHCGKVKDNGYGQYASVFLELCFNRPFLQLIFHMVALKLSQKATVFLYSLDDHFRVSARQHFFRSFPS